MVHNRSQKKSNELRDAHPDPSLIRQRRSQASFSTLCTPGNNNHMVVIKKKSLVPYHCSCSKCLSHGLALSGTPVRGFRMPAIYKCLPEAIQKKYATRALTGSV